LPPTEAIATEKEFSGEESTNMDPSNIVSQMYYASTETVLYQVCRALGPSRAL